MLDSAFQLLVLDNILGYKGKLFAKMDVGGCCECMMILSFLNVKAMMIVCIELLCEKRPSARQRP